MIMKKEIKFKAIFKKADLFNNTLHIIVFPEEGLKTADRLYRLEGGQKLKVSISILND